VTTASDTLLFAAGNTSSLVLGTLNAGGSVLIGAGGLSVAGGYCSGYIYGSGGLTVTGGTLVLTNADAYSGTTVITAGATLQLGNGTNNGSIANSSIVDNAILEFVENSNQSYGNALTTTNGGGQITDGNSNQITLAGLNAFLAAGGTVPGGNNIVP